jgi:PTH1 family peptidyl-tRNA hydrolase
MKLIVGLGNPGRLYENTRHNIGASIIKSFARSHDVSLKREFTVRALTAKASLNDERVVLAVPLTFMNNSGAAVSALAKKYRAFAKDILVVCDDLDLELGRLKIKPSGSSGGHRGLHSIIEALGTKEFARLRVGIDRPYPAHIDAADYVLAPFTKKESAQVHEMVEQACSCFQLWAAEPIATAMNMFNKTTPLKMKGSTI